MGKRIAVFGMGYVGCVTAACLSRDGHHVIGVDISEEKVNSIRRGVAPVAEPGLSELLSAGINNQRLTTSTSTSQGVKESDIGLIAVGTPSTDNGDIHLGAVQSVISDIAEELKTAPRDSPYIIVLRSTLLPGVLEEKLVPQLEASLGVDWERLVQVGNNPEFLRETTAIRDYDAPPFVLVGASDPTVAQSIADIYAHLDTEKILTDTRTAAMVKYACNAYHAAKISFANEIGVLAKAMQANGTKVMEIACQDKQLNISKAYLRPGFAFGGSCLPKDLRALVRFAQKEGVDATLLPSILTSNDAHIQRGLAAVRQLDSKRIGLVGLGFKAGTDDLRESPLVILAETLLGRGYQLKIFDPYVSPSGLVGQNLSYVEMHLPHLASLLVGSFEDVAEHAETLVLGTDIANEVSYEEFQGNILDLRKDLVCFQDSSKN